MKGRFTRARWLVLALEALASGGLETLTIDALCARAEKTRGSFYFHFSSIDVFLLALADHWRVEFTEKVIERSKARVAPRDRLDLLNELAMSLDPRAEQGMRRLAATSSAISQVCQAVDLRRTRYLAELYTASERFSAEHAHALARVEYAAFVGFQIVSPDASPADMRDLYRSFIALTGRG